MSEETVSPTQVQTHTVKPGDDISPRMLRLARFLERLPRGKQYAIFIIKPASPTERWTFQVVETQVLREMDV